MKAIVYECKTPGCGTLLKMRDLPEDTFSTMHFPIVLGNDPIRLLCPDCGRQHEYPPDEYKIAEGI